MLCMPDTQPDDTHLTPVEDAFLQVAPVGHFADLPSHGINLVHQLTLSWAAHSWVAGLPGNAVQVERQQQCFTAHACGR